MASLWVPNLTAQASSTSTEHPQDDSGLLNQASKHPLQERELESLTRHSYNRYLKFNDRNSLIINVALNSVVFGNNFSNGNCPMFFPSIFTELYDLQPILVLPLYHLKKWTSQASDFLSSTINSSQTMGNNITFKLTWQQYIFEGQSWFFSTMWIEEKNKRFMSKQLSGLSYITMWYRTLGFATRLNVFYFSFGILYPMEYG